MSQKEISVRLEEAIDKSVSHIFNAQNPSGFWQGNIFYNAYPTAAMLLVNNILGVADSTWESLAVKWLEEHQGPNGSWGLLDKPALSHPNISVQDVEELVEVQAAAVRNTAAALLALEVFGGSRRSIERANTFMKQVDRQFIDPFTEIFLAYYGRMSWKEVRFPPIEVLLVPSFLKFNIKRFVPAWLQDGLVGALLFKTLNEKSYMRSPFRQQSVSKAKSFLLKNQLRNGSWFNTFQPTVYPLLALKEIGFSIGSDVIQKALAFLDTRKNPVDGYVHRFWLPVWDTALTIQALATVKWTNSFDHIKFRKGIAYLINSRFNNGAWGFSPEVVIYPDNDDTAVSVNSLLHVSVEKEYIKKSIKWLLKMQNSDGGWAAFMRDQASKEPGTLPTSVEDVMVMLKDPSIADVTGHVLQALGSSGLTKEHPAIRRAIRFLKQDQLESGAWYGRWGLCYIYATSRVLRGLVSVGENLEQDYLHKAIRWLLQHQNRDGGWGEHFVAYFRQEYAGIGKSTPVQTAWALLGLMRYLPAHSEAIKRGIEYLLSTQNFDGSWPSHHTVGALEIYENTNYANIFPLHALGEYFVHVNG